MTVGSLAARPRAAWRDERGLTIIETLVATVILAVAFLGMAEVQAVSSKAQSLGKNQTIAASIANRELELMRRSSFAEVVAGSSSTTAEGVAFSVARAVSAAGANKRVEVTTSWTDRFGPRTLRVTTVVSQVTNP